MIPPNEFTLLFLSLSFCNHFAPVQSIPVRDVINAHDTNIMSSSLDTSSLKPHHTKLYKRSENVVSKASNIIPQASDQMPQAPHDVVLPLKNEKLEAGLSSSEWTTSGHGEHSDRAKDVSPATSKGLPARRDQRLIPITNENDDDIQESKSWANKVRVRMNEIVPLVESRFRASKERANEIQAESNKETGGRTLKSMTIRLGELYQMERDLAEPTITEMKKLENEIHYRWGKAQPSSSATEIDESKTEDHGNVSEQPPMTAEEFISKTQKIKQIWTECWPNLNEIWLEIDILTQSWSSLREEQAGVGKQAAPTHVGEVSISLNSIKR